MSLVSRPCRYERRSAPETTMRPRDERSSHAAHSRAAVYAGDDMPSRNFMRAAAIALISAAQPAIAAAQDTFRVFLGGSPIGGERAALVQSADGFTITSSGQLGAPLDIVTRQLT